MSIERTPQDIKQTQEFIRSQERKELWTAQDRRYVREAEFRKFPKGHMQAHLAVADRTVAALIEALEANTNLLSQYAEFPEVKQARALLDSLK